MDQYSIAILVRHSAFCHDAEMANAYFKPLKADGIDPQDMIAWSLHYNDAGKAPVKLIREHLATLLPAMASTGTQTILCADPTYFKVLAGVAKSEPHHGYVLPCKIDGFEYMNVVLSVNYKALFHNPNIQFRLDMSLDTLVLFLGNNYVPPGQSIIHSEHYPNKLGDILNALKSLYQYDEITCDIETFSLQFNKAGIGTIAFAWDEHNGFAFCVDYDEQNNIRRDAIRGQLREFFEAYPGKVTYHGSTFDVKILIYELYMKGMLDRVGLVKGLEVMCKNIEDTKIITYLAHNTTAPLNLDLKSNAFEFAGNYAQDDIKDITKIPRHKLLRYNLTDCLATWYVRKKNTPKMIADDQQEIHDEIMIPSVPVIIQMELTGMPLNMDKVDEADKLLGDHLKIQNQILDASPLITNFLKVLKLERLLSENKKLVQVQRVMSDYDAMRYNPNSNQQTAKLLHEFFGLPVTDRTPTGNPSVGGSSLKKLLNQLKSEHNITDKELI